MIIAIYEKNGSLKSFYRQNGTKFCNTAICNLFANGENITEKSFSEKITKVTPVHICHSQEWYR